MGANPGGGQGGDGRKRRVYAGLLGLGTLGALLALLVNATREHPAPLIGGATVGVTVIFALLAGLTATGRVRLVVLEWVLMVVLAAVVVGNLVHGLYWAPGDPGAVDGARAATHWLPVLFVVAYIALDAQRAATAAMVLIALVVVVAAPSYILAADGVSGLGSAEEFVQVVLAYGVTLVALSFFAGMPQRLVRWREAADEMRVLAFSDALTGLANRRWAEEQLDLELARAARYGGEFAVILIDIDHFKRLNDAYGHAAGDAVLAGLAKTLRRSLRATDQVARWGGEEFVVLAPETPLSGAVDVAEALRREVAAATFDGRPGITISLGVAARRTGDSHESLLARADAALYRAKAAGRDAVAAAPEDAATAVRTTLAAG